MQGLDLTSHGSKLNESRLTYNKKTVLNFLNVCMFKLCIGLFFHLYVLHWSSEVILFVPLGYYNLNNNSFIVGFVKIFIN